MKIGVPCDFRVGLGYFIKADLIRCFESQAVTLIPLLYDTSRINDISRELDGLLLPGGEGDLDPRLYGEEKKYDSVQINRERAEFEFALLDVFLSTKKPLLCICWGLQSLNVYLKGGLFQDLEKQRKTACHHSQKESPEIPTHWVSFERENPFSASKLFVNSSHHQGISQLARDLEIAARAEDGLIEAVQMPKHPFAWGVQWHPERLASDPIIPVFIKKCAAQT